MGTGPTVVNLESSGIQARMTALVKVTLQRRMRPEHLGGPFKGAVQVVNHRLLPTEWRSPMPSSPVEYHVQAVLGPSEKPFTEWQDFSEVRGKVW